MKMIIHPIVYALILLSAAFTSDAKSIYSCNTLKNQNISPGFTENKGQIKGYDGSAHPEVHYVLDGGPMRIFLTKNGIIYQFSKLHYPEGYQEIASRKNDPEQLIKLEQLSNQLRRETHRVDMELVGADPNAKVSAENKSTDYKNYYGDLAFDVHDYGKITYHNIYPGIDWVIYSKDNTLKYDFVVAPGADPGKIRMQFHYQESLDLSADGSFSIKTRMGTITDKMPVSFQGNKEIVTRFKLEDNTISFDLEKYNTKEKILIDPYLVWATYYGGSENDYGTFSTADTQGNVYMGGNTYSSGNIATGGYQNTFGSGTGNIDVYLVKFNSNGVRQWATYYGEGPYSDAGLGGVTDANGNVYVCGTTRSPNAMSFNGHQNTIGGNIGTDAFLVKFNSSGARVWATYYGGPNDETGYSCFTDPSGNIFMAGTTNSSVDIASGGNQNTLNGYTDAFLVKFTNNGTRIWGTYYGGNTHESAFSGICDQAGNIYLSGYTQSATGVGLNGYQNSYGGSGDAFLSKFNPNGVLQWDTYYGDNAADIASSCAVDGLNNVYICGTTQSYSGIASSGGFQTTAGGTSDAFLAKFDNSGTRLWATYYGGTLSENGYFCTTDAQNYVYIAGNTPSSANISFNGYQNNISNTTSEGFIAIFDASGSRLWGSYYGGLGADYIYGGCQDIFGNMYFSGNTASTAGISINGHQSILGGNNDAFLIKFCTDVLQPGAVEGQTLVCSGSMVTFTIIPPTTAYTWTLPAGWSGTSTTNVISAVSGTSGIVKVTGSNSCGTSAVRSINVTVDPCTGFTDITGTTDNLFSIYPNPGNGMFYIKPVNDTPFEIRVYGVTGAEILHASSKDRVFSFDLSSESNGIYFVDVKQNDRVIRTKLVKN